MAQPVVSPLPPEPRFHEPNGGMTWTDDDHLSAIGRVTVGASGVL